MNDLGERAAVWSRYWAVGNAHACPGPAASTYEKEFAQFWQAVTAHLRFPDQLLEIGTGNGALPEQIARSRSIDDMPIIHAVDIADIAVQNNESMPQMRQVHFHSSVAAERLPFENSTFDFVGGQFSIEYTNLALSLAEVSRVSRPGASVALVLHNTESLLCQNAAEEIQHCSWLLEADGLIATTIRLVPYFLRLDLPRGAEANALRLRYNAQQQQLAERAEKSSCPDVLWQTADLCQEVLAQKAGATYLQQQRSGLTDALFRLVELQRAALSKEGLDALVRSLALNGFVSKEIAELWAQDHLLAWTLTAKRNSIRC